MGGYRHRYMYYLTGLPGWMRFGFSPGWLGTSPTGMGPGATYLLKLRHGGRLCKQDRLLIQHLEG